MNRTYREALSWPQRGERPRRHHARWIPTTNFPTSATVGTKNTSHLADAVTTLSASAP